MENKSDVLQVNFFSPSVTYVAKVVNWFKRGNCQTWNMKPCLLLTILIMRYGGVMGNEIFWKIEIKLWGKGSIKGIMAISKLRTNISGFSF